MKATRTSIIVESRTFLRIYHLTSAGLYFGPKSLNPTPAIKKESNCLQ
jgi:hypothetical protein